MQGCLDSAAPDIDCALLLALGRNRSLTGPLVLWPRDPWVWVKAVHVTGSQAVNGQVP